MLFRPRKDMKVRRASFHFLDHDIQKTVKGIRFCMETSSHKNEILCHTETTRLLISEKYTRKFYR